MFDHRDIDIGLSPGESDEELYRLTLVEHAAADRDDQVHVLPDGLEEIAPGVFLGAILASVDVGRLSGYDVVRYVQAQDRQVSHSNANLYEGIGELAYASDPDTAARDEAPGEFASEEIQAALVRTRRSADFELGLGLDLRQRMPPVLEALRTGSIDLARARVFADELATLDPDLIPDVVERVLPDAPDSTTGQLRARLKKLCIQADPGAAEDHFRHGLEDRKIVVYPNPDHTANLGLCSVDPLAAVAASRYVHKIAMRLKRLPDETRGPDQIRADVALDLLQGKTTRTDGNRPVRPEIVLQIASGTGHVPGYGPVLTSALLEQLTRDDENVSVEVLSEDADCGHESGSRRPSKSQARHVRGRYPTCVFPGCRMPSMDCDVDHRRQFSKGGRTMCPNLAPLCRRHHRCKDEGGWNLTRQSNGDHGWTSPLAHRYRTRRPP